MLSIPENKHRGSGLIKMSWISGAPKSLSPGGGKNKKCCRFRPLYFLMDIFHIITIFHYSFNFCLPGRGWGATAPLALPCVDAYLVPHERASGHKSLFFVIHSSWVRSKLSFYTQIPYCLNCSPNTQILHPPLVIFDGFVFFDVPVPLKYMKTGILALNDLVYEGNTHKTWWIWSDGRFTADMPYLDTPQRRNRWSDFYRVYLIRRRIDL